MIPWLLITGMRNVLAHLAPLIESLEGDVGWQNTDEASQSNELVAMAKHKKKKTPRLTGQRARRDEAQRIMWEASDVVRNDQKKAARLCHMALKIYPHCTDALTMLAEIESQTVDQFLDRLRQAVAAGRQDLGPKCFEEDKGYFWGLIETRPFMRAMGMLADALINVGTSEALGEAISIHEEMLDLNPNDNQGVRDWLGGSYLALKRYDDAAALFNRYAEDWLAAPAWARVLHACVTEGEMQATRRLQEARKRNPYVEAYLTGRKSRPRTRPGYYSPGDDSEALYCADMLWQAWHRHPNAREWLKQAGEPELSLTDGQRTLFTSVACDDATNSRKDTQTPAAESKSADPHRTIALKLACADEGRIDASRDPYPDSDLQEMFEDVPKAYRARFADLIELLDVFCAANLNIEYRDLCREMACSLCQTGSPVRTGQPAGWAAGIVYALGQVNFLTDPSQTPHMKSEQVASGFGVSVATMHTRAKIIRKAFGGLVQLHPDWTLPSRMDQNPLVWLHEVNGILIDLRTVPRDVQVRAYEHGLIPYIPADRDA